MAQEKNDERANESPGALSFTRAFAGNADDRWYLVQVLRETPQQFCGETNCRLPYSPIPPTVKASKIGRQLGGASAGLSFPHRKETSLANRASACTTWCRGMHSTCMPLRHVPAA